MQRYIYIQTTNSGYSAGSDTSVPVQALTIEGRQYYLAIDPRGIAHSVVNTSINDGGHNPQSIAGWGGDNAGHYMVSAAIIGYTFDITSIANFYGPAVQDSVQIAPDMVLNVEYLSSNWAPAHYNFDPSAENHSFNVGRAASFSAIAAAGVLNGAEDEDGDPLHVADSNGADIGAPLQGQHGLLALNADGSFTYKVTSNSGGPWSDVFLYSVVDNFGGRSLQSVQFNGSTPLFSEEFDYVDFNKLEGWQLDSILNGDQTMNALGGNDTVFLPIDELAASRVRYNPSLAFNAGDGENTVVGGNLSDTIRGGKDVDHLSGEGGADFLYGFGGRDVLSGGDGRDTISDVGDMGGNQLFGGDDLDQLFSSQSLDGAAPDTLIGGAGVDQYYIDTTPNAPDVIVDFEQNETASTFRGNIDPTRYLIKSDSQGTIINFFNNSGDTSKIASFKFQNYILPGDLRASVAGFTIQVGYIRDEMAHARKIYEILKPFIDVMTEFAVNELQEYAEEIGTKLTVSKALRFVDEVLQKDTKLLDVVKSSLIKTVSSLGLTDAQVKDISKEFVDKIIEEVKDGIISSFTGAADKDEYQNEWLESALSLSKPLSYASPALKGLIEIAPELQKLSTLAMKTYFANEASQLVRKTPDFGGGDLKPVNIVGPHGTVSFVYKASDITKSRGSSGEDHLYSNVDVKKLPGNIENASLLGGQVIKKAIGSLTEAGPKILNGNALHNELTGNTLANSIAGDSGNDTLYARGGNDDLVGGRGADNLYGGTGKDKFIFLATSDSTVSTKGRDTIYDFSKGDRIDVSGIDANGKIKGDAQFSFIGKKAFGGHAGELRYEKLKSDTIVYGDVNGDKKADFGIHLDDAVNLTKTDFWL